MKNTKRQTGRYKPETRTIQFHNVPTETARQFKAWCITHDVSMKDKIVELLEEVIKR